VSQNFTFQMPWRRLLREGVIALGWSGVLIGLQVSGSRLDILAVAALGDVLERLVFWLWSLPWLLSGVRLDKEGIAHGGQFLPLSELESARYQPWHGPMGWLVFGFRRGTLWVPTALPGWDQLWSMLYLQRPDRLNEPIQTGLAQSILSGKLRKPQGVAEPSVYRLKPSKWPSEPSRILTWIQYSLILLLVNEFVPLVGNLKPLVAGALLYGFFRAMQLRRDRRLWI
jgi:hypothetical protein